MSQGSELLVHGSVYELKSLVHSSEPSIHGSKLLLFYLKSLNN